MLVQWSLLFLTLVSQIQCGSTPADASVLEALYNATSSKGWVDEWAFTSDVSYLTLNGITWSSDNSYAESINLTMQNLDGEIPDSFTTLTSPIWIEMVGNKLTYLPDLSTMSTLKDLNLTFNKITNYTGGFHANIVNVTIANNSLANVDLDLLYNLVNSTTISMVNLSGNTLSGSLNGILDNDNIEYLDLSSNDLSGSVTPTTKDVSGWVKLYLGWNFFTGSYPTDYKGLDTVDLRCNMFDCEDLTNSTGWGIGECMCPDKGYYAVIQDDDSVQCTVCPDGSIANKWVKIELPDVTSDYHCYGPTTTASCQQCFYPSNCVGGACKEGSDGPTCERCETGYRMIGGECEECHSTNVPFSAVVLLVIVVVIVAYGVFLSGLNIVSATMIKQLFSYLQIFHLTMDIRAPWPRYMSELGDIYKFSMLNTQAIQLECYTALSTASLFYINWATAVGWPILTTIIVTIICKSLSARIHKLERSGSEVMSLKAEGLRKSQTGIRRVYLLFMIIAFVPITSLSIRTFACETWIGYDYTLAYNGGDDVIQNQFFYDNSMSCWDYTFQGINFLATIFVVTEAGILVFLFLLLFRLWKFNEKDKHNEYFGALYESFKPSGLFCEPVQMFRKFILILTTQLMYLTPFMAGVVNAVVSFGWLLAVCILRPYKSSFEDDIITASSSQTSTPLRTHHPIDPPTNDERHDSPIQQLPGALLSNWCNLFEIFATLMILIIHILSLMQGDTLDLWSSFNMDAMDYTLFTLNIILLLVWIMGFCYVLVKHTRTDIEERKSLRSRRNTIRLNTIQREATEDNKDEAISIFEEREEEFDESAGASTGNPVVIVNDVPADVGRGSRGSLELTNHQ